MGLLIHSHRHHFGSTAGADLAAMLIVVERGFDFSAPAPAVAEPEDDGWTYECAWCGHIGPDAHDYYGANLCEGCRDEVNARHDAADFRDGE